MQGAFLRFYVHEGERHHGKLLWEWLLDEASRMGLRGGSAFRAMAGFGRHHTLHANHFFELAGELPVEVEFIVSDEEASALLDLIEREGVRVFYARIPASFDVINADGAGGRG
jgi:PII-like signaling protein